VSIQGPDPTREGGEASQRLARRGPGRPPPWRQLRSLHQAVVLRRAGGVAGPRGVQPGSLRHHKLSRDRSAGRVCRHRGSTVVGHAVGPTAAALHGDLPRRSALGAWESRRPPGGARAVRGRSPRSPVDHPCGMASGPRDPADGTSAAGTANTR
jgi:hypothetical protein